jgi:hypothetical protein
MGLFDRLFSSGSGANSAASGPKARKPAETVYLDADQSSSLGDVNFMRRSNTIRRTFPGTSEGLPGAASDSGPVSLSDGVPKPVKKTFAQTMSQAELDQRKKGSAVGVNVPGGPAAIKQEKEQKAAAASSSAQPALANQQSALNTAKPGAIDPFKQMVKDLNS